MINIIGNVIGQNKAAGEVIPPSPLLTNLVSYWGMDESSSPVAIVDSVSAYNATPSGTITSEAGILGNALRFDGTVQADVPNQAALNPTTAISVQVWFYVSADTGGAQTMVSKVVSGSAHSSPFFGWSMHLLRVNATTFQPRWWITTSDRASGDSRLGPNTLAINTWHHVVGTFTAGALELTTNGVKLVDATPSAGTLSQYTSPVRFGAHGNSAERFNGRLDSVGVWSRVLSDVEIAQLYNSGAGLNYPFQ